MEDEGKASCLNSLAEKFPDLHLHLVSFLEQDEIFLELCEQYIECCEAVGYWKRTEQTYSSDILYEFIDLQQLLEQEILDRLRELQ
jgi:hypothetical protein